MPFVTRNDRGVIISLHRVPLSPDQEYLELENPEVLGFLQEESGDAPAASAHERAAVVMPQPPAEEDRNVEGFKALDEDFVRVLEDLIDVMLPGYETLMRLDNRRGALCRIHLQKTNRPMTSPAEAQALSGFESLREMSFDLDLPVQ